jgi:alanyl-tRNA synthetase/misacylated tRNA(Ala) deacylase
MPEPNDTPIPASLASPHALTSYHTFHSDLPPSNVPEGYYRFHPHLKPETFPETKIVGLLACQRDPYLRELKGVEIVQAKKAEAGKKGKDERKKKSKLKGDEKKEDADGDEKVVEGEVWEVELKDTVLFPEGRSLSSFLYLLPRPTWYA